MKNLIKEKILVTGCAGFIGMHLSKALLERGHDVIGVDNLNPYYDVRLKNDRLMILKKYDNFNFTKLDISNKEALENIFKTNIIDKVVNLAAQAGVRYSILYPESYIKSNVSGFLNVLECCKDYNRPFLIYASSSSVYGQNNKLPFNEIDSTSSPVSLYAASKKSNELMARVYYEIYKLKSVGLRFFTVYGPWGRPDMAYFKFTKNILNDNPIKIFNNGNMLRDFTYIDDTITGLISAIDSDCNFEIINIGNNKAEKLLDMVRVIENYLSKKADISFEPMQPGDVKKTYANIRKAKQLLDFNPSTKLDNGLQSFIDWYIEYYK